MRTDLAGDDRETARIDPELVERLGDLQCPALERGRTTPALPCDCELCELRPARQGIVVERHDRADSDCLRGTRAERLGQRQWIELQNRRVALEEDADRASAHLCNE